MHDGASALDLLLGGDPALYAIVGLSLYESRRWLFYDVPKEFASARWQGRWQGQRQKWFVMIFKGRDSDIDLAGEVAAFDAWRWASPGEVCALAAPFKRQLYQDVIGEFSTIFRD